MNRDQAYALMVQHTPSASLQRHMLNVEAAMRAYARHWGEDEELYAVAGLLHDFDYELHPEEHPTWGVNYLRAHTDTPPEVLDAILGHAAYTGVPRTTKLAQSLFAVDELTGLVQAAAGNEAIHPRVRFQISDRAGRWATRWWARTTPSTCCTR